MLVETAFFSIFSAYQQICSEFLATNVLPHVGKLHALSSAVRASCSLDINLKLFDLLGRLATDGIWAYWGACRCSDEEAEAKQRGLQEAWMFMSSVKALISNNPALLLPAKDDQAIDIFIAASLLALDENNYDDVKKWLAEMLGRASFAYQVHGHYPCILHSYSDLLSHPKSGDNEYRKNVTSGSILYPIIALWAALLDDEETYNNIAPSSRSIYSIAIFSSGIRMNAPRRISIRTVTLTAQSYRMSALIDQKKSFSRRCLASAINRPISKKCQPSSSIGGRWSLWPAGTTGCLCRCISWRGYARDRDACLNVTGDL
jgi:hypothetical protein